LSDAATPILGTCEISCSKNDEPNAIGKGSLYDYPGEKTLKLMDDHGKVAVEIWPLSVEDISLIDAATRKLGRGVEETFRISGLTRDGDSYTAYVQCNEPNAFQRTKEAIETHRAEIGEGRKPDEYVDALVKLLKLRLRVNLSEIGSLLATYGLPGDVENARREAESLIDADKVEGMVDGNTFISRYAISTRAARYSVAVSFDFKDGALQIRCPNCAAAIPLKDKNPTGTCKYCGSAYMVPAKVLRLTTDD
jgi:hypothetical protein